MKRNKEPTNQELEDMVRSLCISIEYNNDETGKCIEIMSKAIKNIVTRLELLEDYIYNEDRDDEYLN